MPTIHTVAELARVSIATVSRVMNDPHKVKESTRLRVQAAMQSLDFSPNGFAASLVTRRSDCVGLVVAELSGDFFAPLINVAEEVVSAAGSSLIVSCGKDTVVQVEGALQFLRQRRCDAIILYPGQLSDAALADILAAHTNVVVIHRMVKGFEARCVQVDNRTGARLAARYLIDCGHQDIAVITGNASNGESQLRLSAFRATLKAAHLPLKPELVFEGDFHMDSGRRGMAEFLAAAKPPSAVFCLNDQMAFGAMDYCREVGVEVPGRISIMGFDDVEYSRLVHPRLSTVHHPIRELARVAADMALLLAAGAPLPLARHLLPSRLVIRDSVRHLN